MKYKIIKSLITEEMELNKDDGLYYCQGMGIQHNVMDEMFHLNSLDEVKAYLNSESKLYNTHFNDELNDKRFELITEIVENERVIDKTVEVHYWACFEYQVTVIQESELHDRDLLNLIKEQR